MTPAQRDLAAAYLPLAKSICAPYERDFPRLRSEFFSACQLALCMAAARFDPSRRVKFPHYAKRRIRGACQDVLRESCPLGYRFSSRQPPVIVSFEVCPEPLPELAYRDLAV